MQDNEANTGITWWLPDGQPLPEGKHLVILDSDGETTTVHHLPLEDLMALVGLGLRETLESQEREQPRA